MHATHFTVSHVHGFNGVTDGPICPGDLHAPNTAPNAPPSAITQGIVLPFDTLLVVVTITMLAVAPAMLYCPVFLPPPREPPRLQFRFAA